MSIRPFALLVATVTAVALLAPAALAQSTAEVRIREAALDDDGSVQLVVNVVGDEVPDVVSAEAFHVTEQGEPVELAEVQPLLEEREQTVAVALLIDVSGSTRGEPLARATAAAAEFARVLTERGVLVAVLTFATEVEVVADFTTDAAAVEQALVGLEAADETALHDGIIAAAAQLAAVEGQRNLVIFSDGGDTASAADFETAVAALDENVVSATTVALTTDEFDGAALESLATSTGGQAIAVDDAASLSEGFERIARTLSSQYVLRYASDDAASDELRIAVAVDVAGVQVADEIVSFNPRIGIGPTGLTPVEPSVPSVPIAALSDENGLYVGVGAAFVAVLLLLSMLLVSPQRSRAERGLSRSIGHVSKGRRRHASDVRLSASELRGRAAELVDRLPKPEGYEDRLQLRLDRAGWPLRANEFTALRLTVAAGTLVMLLVVSAAPALALLLAMLSAYAPTLVLLRRTKKRANEVDEALPDTLQLLAGSLRAGYGLMQALDLAAREGQPPLSSELGRALTEIRLGVPVEQALEDVADRIDNEDLRWVVMAINIQRTVGGNLAELLETVSETIRSRQSFRRHLAALSADGRLSAWILSLLPVIAALLLIVVNGDYIKPLYTTGAGLAMVVISLTFLAVGVTWIRSIIKIEM